MKSMSFSVFIVLIIFVTGCKKEEYADPDIVYTEINKTLTLGTITTEYFLDIDKDGNNDLEFYFVPERYLSGIKYYITAAQVTALNNTTYTFLAVDNNFGAGVEFKIVESGIIDTNFVKYYPGSNLAPLQQTWLSIQFRKMPSSATIDIHVRPFVERPPCYFPLYMEKLGYKYFGWVQVSTSEDGRSMTIYNAAISKLPDVAVKAGEK